MDEVKEPIKIYLDEEAEPFKVDQPPLRFNFSTIQLPDGPHKLRVEASNGLAPPTIKEIPFRVRNGVALSVSGLQEGQTISGQVELIINAYAGNTEVDFEPRRAETPQPIPTWAWVVLLGVIAWTMFYVLNPTVPPRDASAGFAKAHPLMGERIYTDLCARCHGEDGSGRWNERDGFWAVPRLRDNKDLALQQSPYGLLIKIVQGVQGSPLMRDWGPVLTNNELVAVTNHVRTAWGHDASQIDLRHRRPPAAIEALEERMKNAMLAMDASQLADCCWPESRPRPQLFRVDGIRAAGTEDVAAEWKRYFADLDASKGKIRSFELTEERYDYEPATVHQDGAIVIGMGRVFLETENQNGVESRRGRFIRVYRHATGFHEGEEPQEGHWSLIFDFADIPMRLGCVEEHELECPPEELETPPQPVELGPVLGYAGVQQLITNLQDHKPRDSPHEDFWSLPYEEFVAFEFPQRFDGPKADNVIKLLVKGDSEASNLVRILRDQSIYIQLPDGTMQEVQEARMPKYGASMAEVDVARIAQWIDAGCPEMPPPPGSGGAGGSPPAEPGPTPPAAPTGDGIGFAEVVAIFKGIGKSAAAAPHEDFWKLPYRAFVELEFPESWDDAENMMRMIKPWDAKGSNLIKALVDGKGLEIRLPNGTTRTRDITRMPKGSKPLSSEQIAQIAAWIDAGCPEVAGGPSPWPKPGAGGAAAPAPKENGGGGGAKAPEKPADDGGGFPDPKK